MSNKLEAVLVKIAAKNPRHAQKLRSDLQAWDSQSFARFDRFCERYEDYLERDGRDLDYGVEAYLNIIETTLKERMRLSLGNQLFSEPQLKESTQQEQERHLNGMMFARFLWRQQFALSQFYADHLPRYAQAPLRYLEICGDQWVWVEDTMDALGWVGVYDVLELNEGTSELAHEYMPGRPISFLSHDLDAFREAAEYDLIVIGQVLGRMADPRQSLERIKDLLHDEGTIFFSATVNAPVRSRRGFSSLHILKELILESGLKVEQDLTMVSDDLPMDRVEPLKAAISYGAFLKKA